MCITGCHVKLAAPNRPRITLDEIADIPLPQDILYIYNFENVTLDGIPQIDATINFATASLKPVALTSYFADILEPEETQRMHHAGRHPIGLQQSFKVFRV